MRIGSLIGLLAVTALARPAWSQALPVPGLAAAPSVAPQTAPPAPSRGHDPIGDLLNRGAPGDEDEPDSLDAIEAALQALGGEDLGRGAEEDR